jgi:hypothetical protein
MTTSEPKAGERVKDVHFSEDTISVDLVDGRTITALLAWFPRLLHATVNQRANWRIAGGGCPKPCRILSPRKDVMCSEPAALEIPPPF